MSVRFVRGDIFLTRAQAIAVGLSANGRLEVSSLHTTLQDRWPVFVSEYHRRGRAGTLPPGSIWTWREGQPWLLAAIIRETPPGAARLRYIEAVLLNLYKNWRYEGLLTLAMMRLGDDQEWASARDMAAHYLNLMALPVVIYEEFLPGVEAETGV